MIQLLGCRDTEKGPKLGTSLGSQDFQGQNNFWDVRKYFVYIYIFRYLLDRYDLFVYWVKVDVDQSPVR